MMAEELFYLLNSKRQLDLSATAKNCTTWNTFISAFNDSDRVKSVFANVSANNKYWLALTEYSYTPAEVPQDFPVLSSASTVESDFLIETLGSIPSEILTGGGLCIDITGFMRPHILFALRYLRSIGVLSFDMLYTEPQHYRKKSETSFTLEDVHEVRQVAGFEGNHVSEMSGDLLIIGVGYDHNLISRVILSKESARLVQLHSLPSLSADMYQESLLRLDRVSSAPARIADDHLYFSNANDPFVTAAVLSEAYQKLSEQNPVSNLYLSPLATKPQALGFGLFYLHELEDKPASIIFPFCSRYERETGTGIGRSWIYEIQL